MQMLVYLELVIMDAFVGETQIPIVNSLAAYCCYWSSMLVIHAGKLGFKHLVGPLFKVLKQFRRDCRDVSNNKLQVFRVFLDKDFKIVGISDPLSIGQ